MREFGIGVIIFVVLLALGGVVTYKTWTLGNDGSDYETVCIGGHEYYRANFANKGFLSIRMTDDGKPVRCDQ